MVMENMFGDILSDQGGGILGSLGLMPSACIGPDKAYYEPSHGSAPDIAGQGIANPYSMIGSFAMMLEYSFGMHEEAKNVWDAMQGVFGDGFSTARSWCPWLSSDVVFIGMGGLGLTKDGGLTKAGGGALTGGMRAGCCVGSGSANNVGGGAFAGPGAGGASGGVGGGEGT